MQVETEQIEVKEPELLWGDPVLTPKGEFAIADRVGFTWATVQLLDGTEERHKILELTRLVGKLPPNDLPLPRKGQLQKGDRVRGVFGDGEEIEGRVCGVIGEYCLLIDDEGFLLGSVGLGEIEDQAEDRAEATDPLARLALEINQAHTDYEEAGSTALNAGRSAVQSALIAGEKLCLAKEEVPHGEWLLWLERNCPKVSQRSAQRYMRIWRKRDELPKSDTGDGFGLKQALELLATPREEALSPAEEEPPRSEELPVPVHGDRPKPVPTLEFTKNLFSQLGTIEPWKVRGGEGFVVRNEAIGTPFPLAFPNAQSAWNYWNERQEGIQRLLTRLQAKASPGSSPSVSAEAEPVATSESPLPESPFYNGYVQEAQEIQEAIESESSAGVSPAGSESSRKERLEGDKYYSPDGLIQGLLDQVEITGEVLDPCAGDCRMAEIVTEKTPAWVYTADLSSKFGVDRDKFDATVRSDWEAFIRDLIDEEELAWTITNPPFNQAYLILPLAWEFSKVGVAFLLRLSWLEPCANRADWMKEHADHLTNVIVFNPRPQFREDTNGGDQVTVAWFVWRKDFSWQKQGLPCPFTFITDWRNP